MAVLAILLYAGTWQHGFVLDDDVVIVKNQFVQRGWAGVKDIFTHDSFAGYERVNVEGSVLEGGRYRPLSLVWFALLVSLFGSKAWVFHAFVIICYALCGALLYQVLRRVLKEIGHGDWIAFLSALLFVAHPVHTEVVANVKSADEILSMLFGLGALYSLFRAFDTGRALPAWVAAGSILLACLAKESAVTLVVTIPLALWYFRKTTWFQVGSYAIPLVMGVAAFLLMRAGALGGEPSGTVMHDPLNNPFLTWTGEGWTACTAGERWATIVYVLGRYVGLVFFPFPLTHDYYPFHITLQSFSAPAVWASLALLVGILALALRSLKTRALMGYGAWFFLISISMTSNILFPVGTYMAERFLFMPSLGILFGVIAWAISLSTFRSAVPWIVLGITIVFSILTLMRTPAWKDNRTLFATDIAISANSAKLQNDYGTLLLDDALKMSDPSQQKAQLQEALPHLRRAIELHPTYYDAMLAYGACAYYVQQYAIAAASYRQALRLYPGDAKSTTGLVYSLQALAPDQWSRQDSTGAVQSLEEAYQLQPDTAIAARLADYYRAMGLSQQGMEWDDKAHGELR